MYKTQRKEYDAPNVEVLAARVESGFQISGDGNSPSGSNEELVSSGESHDGSDFD